MNYSDIIISSKNEFNFYDKFKKLNIKFNDLLINIRNNKDVLSKLLILLSINVDLFNTLLLIIKKYYSCNEWKRIYCIEYNLILILQVKNNTNNWKSLQKLIICDTKRPKGDKCALGDSNYNNVYKQFRRWVKHDLFNKAYLSYVPSYINSKQLLRININASVD